MCSTGRSFDLNMISCGDIAASGRTVVAFVTSTLERGQRTVASVVIAIMRASAMYLRMASLHRLRPPRVPVARPDCEATEICAKAV